MITKTEIQMTKMKLKKAVLIIVLMCVGCNFFETKKKVDSTKKLVGTWYADGYRNSKWVYNKNGILYNYYDNKLVEVFKYSLSNSCGNNKNDTIEYVKMIDKDSIEYCFKINSINEKNNGVLSMKNMDTGDTVRFVNKVDGVVNPDSE